MAGVTLTCVVKVTAKTCLAGWTFAIVVAEAIVTRSPIVARTDLAIICVGGAVDALPAIHTDTLVRPTVVHAGRPVLAWLSDAFVYILRAILALPGWRTFAYVALYSVDTGGAIGTPISHTLIDVHATMMAAETWGAAALEAEWASNVT